MPDIIGKVAWDPTIADRSIHMEAFGIFRQFTDRIVYPVGVAGFPYGTGLQNHNNTSTGEGVGGSILIPVIPTVFDIQFSGLTGRGIGRYGSGQLPDVTYNADGSLAPTIGIGGCLTAPPLPHHRAYGSVPRRFD
jgi:hypothetical protein